MKYLGFKAKTGSASYHSLQCLALLSIFALTLSPLAQATGITLNNNGANIQPTRMIAAPQQNGNQTTAQQDTQKKNKEGEGLAKIAGMLSMAMGGVMIQKGTAQTPPNTMMIMSGALMLVQGLLGLKGAKKAGENANAAGNNAAAMGGTYSGLSGLGDSTIGQAQFKIDPSLLREGKLGDAMNDVEKNLGIGRDQFAEAAASDANMAKLLADSPGGKKAGINEGKLSSMLDTASNKLAENPEAGKALLEKTGFNAAMATYSLGSGASSSSLKASKDMNFDDFMASLNSKDNLNSPSAGGALNLSPEVQAALDKNGISDKSIFEMVKIQYKKQAPQMFGQDRQPASATDPFGLQSQGI